MRIALTGASGVIGSELYKSLNPYHEVIGIDIGEEPPGISVMKKWVHADITDHDAVGALCREHIPDIVIHCAGIAHQKAGAVKPSDYMAVNVDATDWLARCSGSCNPRVRFIFLSSVSVYGEQYSGESIREDAVCRPTSIYAESKLEAEKRLRNLYDHGQVHSLDILRLAPVYGRDFLINLNRRVMAPGNIAYVRFGSGMQRMSALALPNIIDFIGHILLQDTAKQPGFLRIVNVSDSQDYTFVRIINALRASCMYGMRPTFPVPLAPIWLLTRTIGAFSRQDLSTWWHACYDKLAKDLVFSKECMLATGYHPRYSLEDCVGRGTTGVACLPMQGEDE